MGQVGAPLFIKTSSVQLSWLSLTCLLQKSFKMAWFSKEAIENIELFVILKIENWPTKSAGGIKGGG